MEKRFLEAVVPAAAGVGPGLVPVETPGSSIASELMVTPVMEHLGVRAAAAVAIRDRKGKGPVGGGQTGSADEVGDASGERLATSQHGVGCEN